MSSGFGWYSAKGNSGAGPPRGLWTSSVERGRNDRLSRKADIAFVASTWGKRSPTADDPRATHPGVRYWISGLRDDKYLPQ